MIEPELARRFIEQLTQYTEYNINIMDESGTIIASRDPKRVGTFHEAAALVVSGGNDLLAVEDDTTYPGVLPGINMVIMHEGRREGVVGVTGDPSQIREVALITRLALEAMVRYEKQQEKIRARQNRKDHFITLLARTEHADPAEIRSMAAQLGYEETPVRIPILCRIDPGGSGNGMAADTPIPGRRYGKNSCTPAALLERLHRGDDHTLQDISCLLDDSRVLIFKTLRWGQNRHLRDYRDQIQDYLEGTAGWAKTEGASAVFFIGTLQQSFSQYYYSFRHCKWLEEHLAGSDLASRHVFYFHDYAQEYLRSLLPRQELQRIFQVYAKDLDNSVKKQLLETVCALRDANYNLAEAARNLYLHKNTMAYRYNKVKDLFGIDPLVNAADRGFLETLYQYLNS